MQLRKMQESLIDEASFYKRDALYLKMAKTWSENSYCQRNKVGCLVVKDGAIVSDGYNGTPHGFPNVCETIEGDTHPYVLHAEANAITKIAKSNNSSEGATIYITLSRCSECAKHIIQAGIKKVVFCELYRKTESLELLEQAGIELLQINLA
jgi:dCMP deaminase